MLVEPYVCLGKKIEMLALIMMIQLYTQNLEVKGAPGLYVCDMSVMPVSTAANPVRALGGLALRLSKHLLQN